MHQLIFVADVSARIGRAGQIFEPRTLDPAIYYWLRIKSSMEDPTGVRGCNGKCYTRDRLRRWVPCSPSSFRVARGGRAPVHATRFQALSWSELRASRASFFKAQTSSDRSHVPAFPVAVCQGKPPVAASNAEPACSMLGLQKALRCSRHESSDSKAAPSSGGKFFSGPSAFPPFARPKVPHPHDALPDNPTSCHPGTRPQRVPPQLSRCGTAASERWRASRVTDRRQPLLWHARPLAGTITRRA